MKPYPLLLKPPIKDYLWGGTRLITDFGFETTSAKAAEAWVLSCHKDGASLIANGELAGHTLPEALDQWGDAAVGDKDVTLTAKLSAEETGEGCADIFVKAVRLEV